MYQTPCLRRWHRAPDQKYSCLCYSKTSKIQSTMRGIRASTGMHGWPPDTTAPLHSITNDSLPDRQELFFTPDRSHHAAQPAPGPYYSHPLPNHEPGSLCPSTRNSVQHHTNRETQHTMITNNLSSDVLDLFRPADFEHDTLSTWPRGSIHNTNFYGFTHTQELPQTIDPVDLTRQLPADPLVTAPPPVPRYAAAVGKKSASINSPSHVSTPSLTPQTREGSCSTPETSVDGVADDHRAFFGFRSTIPNLQRYKAILPAPPKHASPTLDEFSRIELPGWPKATPFLNPRDPATDGSIAQEVCQPVTPLNPNTIVDFRRGDGCPRLEKGTWWRQPSVDCEATAFEDVERFMNIEGGGCFDAEAVQSGYPPLTDHAFSSCSFPAWPGNPIDYSSTNDIFLSTYPVDINLSSSEEAGIDSLLDTIGVQRSSIGSAQHHTVGNRESATPCGEGSRRDTSRDDELRRYRSQGMSYREIKQRFGFTEAESTLRGRYRTLTKDKNKRVRKPIWKDKDVSQKWRLAVRR